MLYNNRLVTVRLATNISWTLNWFQANGFMQRETTSSQNYRFDFRYENSNNVHTPSFIQIKFLKILQPLFHKNCENDKWKSRTN
jgi:hypothetical protein